MLVAVSSRARRAALAAAVALLVPASLTATVSEAATVPSWLVNFQAPGAAPSGHTADVGAPYTRAAGYGWVAADGSGTPVDLRANAVTRDEYRDDIRNDSFVTMNPLLGARGGWRLAVADGTYLVGVAVGDSSPELGQHVVSAEGTRLVDVTVTPDKRHGYGEARIVVTDGFLDLTPGASGTKIQWTKVRWHSSSTASSSTTTTARATSTTTTTTTTATVPGGSTRIGAIAGFAPGGRFPGYPIEVIERELDAMASSGATYLRMLFSWSSVESTKGTYNFRKLDQIADAARARGIQIIANVSYAPRWARDSRCADSLFCQPSNPADYARYMKALVDHFKPKGVKIYEQWNEPNMAIFWGPLPSIDRYTALVKATWNAVKPAHPDVVLLAGSFAPARDLENGRQIRGTTFLTGMYDRGVRGYFDHLSFHPYQRPHEPTHQAEWHSFTGVVPALKQIMVDRGDSLRSRSIWGTEYGYHTGTDTQSVDEQTQKKRVEPSYVEWQKLSTAPLIWFSYRDSGTDLSDSEYNSGLVRNDFSPKPAWPEFKRVMALPRS